MRRETFPSPEHVPHPATGDERRSSARASTVLLIGKVHDGRGETACLVLNLSDVGLMARLAFTATVGQRIMVELRGLPAAAATVRWVNGAKAGMQFDKRQNLEPVFSLMSEDGQVARPPRFDVSLTAVVRFAERRFDAHIVNISPGGMRLASDLPVEPGETGQIVLAARKLSLFGSVRWVANGEFGFHFSNPLPLASLKECLSG